MKLNSNESVVISTCSLFDESLRLKTDSPLAFQLWAEASGFPRLVEIIAGKVELLANHIIQEARLWVELLTIAG